MLTSPKRSADRGQTKCPKMIHSVLVVLSTNYWKKTAPLTNNFVGNLWAKFDMHRTNHYSPTIKAFLGNDYLESLEKIAPLKHKKTDTLNQTHFQKSKYPFFYLRHVKWKIIQGVKIKFDKVNIFLFFFNMPFPS